MGSLYLIIQKPQKLENVTKQKSFPCPTIREPVRLRVLHYLLDTKNAPSVFTGNNAWFYIVITAGIIAIMPSLQCVLFLSSPHCWSLISHLLILILSLYGKTSYFLVLRTVTAAQLCVVTLPPSGGEGLLSPFRHP